MRIATAMEGVHYVLHAPQGDTYADLLFTMIERRDQRPPVTYTTFQARDLGGDTAELFKTAAREAYERFQPAGHAGRRLLHRRADPGRSRRARPGARAAGAGGAAGTARLPAEGKLGRGGDILPVGPRLRRPARAAGRHGASRPPGRDAGALQSPRADRPRLPPPRRCRTRSPTCSGGSAST